jgi:hypothetical protein
MSALAKISAQVIELSQRDTSALEDVLSEISSALSDLLVVLERPTAEAAVPQVTVNSPSVIVNSPDVIVNVPEARPVINVQPASVVVMPAPESAMKGWRLVVTERDGNGAIYSVNLIPEK